MHLVCGLSEKSEGLLFTPLPLPQLLAMLSLPLIGRRFGLSKCLTKRLFSANMSMQVEAVTSASRYSSKLRVAATHCSDLERNSSVTTVLPAKLGAREHNMEAANHEEHTQTSLPPCQKGELLPSGGCTSHCIAMA